SGNIGATNVGRLLGGKYFALVFTLDLLKSLLPTAAAGVIIGRAEPDARTYLLWLLVGFAAFVGHMCPIFLRFHGGTGVPTIAGVLLGIFPYYTSPGLIAIGLWLLIFLALRYVSVASMVGTVTFAILYMGIGIAAGWDVFGRQLPL